jgi:uncharacterized membrane protein YdbT with pleckstrin-like domain
MEPAYSEHPPMFRNSPITFIAAIVLIPVGIGLLMLIYLYLKSKATKLEIRGNVVVLERGILSKDRTETRISSIRSVNVSQSLFDRMFGVGKISIATAGDSPEIIAKGMPRPDDFREQLKATRA